LKTSREKAAKRSGQGGLSNANEKKPPMGLNGYDEMGVSAIQQFPFWRQSEGDSKLGGKTSRGRKGGEKTRKRRRHQKKGVNVTTSFQKSPVWKVSCWKEKQGLERRTASLHQKYLGRGGKNKKRGTVFRKTNARFPRGRQRRERGRKLRLRGIIPAGKLQ